ncbi:MAG: N-6 DNA methylase, partial [Gammaproteobacteria bacterium]|nr:N-6 DNA methylase [Gammaproteobacteria bacterium]
ALDWSAISPAIFGALFQSIMDGRARRNLGAHYTSEENILKLIGPLFLDDLKAEFQRARNNKNKLFEFHKKLRTLTFFDPACGCGNFLVIAYRELRKLELEVLRASYDSGQQVLDVHQLIGVNVDQFYGIEIEEFPAQIAQVALWLMDHQMNMRVSEEFGMYFARIPLKSTPHIHHANALTLDWNAVLPVERASFVFGNPPFVGAKYMSDAQREETRQVFSGIGNGGLLDFVAAWYVKAAHYITSPRPAPARSVPAASGSEAARSGETGEGPGERGRGRGDVPAAPSSPPTASARANRSACCGAGCWARACTSTSPIAPSSGATKRKVRRRCIASLSVSAPSTWTRKRFRNMRTFAASRMRSLSRISIRIWWMHQMWR